MRDGVPDEIVAGSILLNTAYALFCDRLLGTPATRSPTSAAGFKELGVALLGIFDEVPSDPASDGALVDRWARRSASNGSYQWVPLAVPSRSCREGGPGENDRSLHRVSDGFLPSRLPARRPGLGSEAFLKAAKATSTTRSSGTVPVEVADGPGMASR